MTTSCATNLAKIIVGSKAEFTIFLVDEFGRPISLSPYTSGNIVFCNTKGIRTVIALVVPGANPDKGELAVLVSAVNAADADKKWKDADIELISAGPETTIVPLNDKFEIIARNCPV
jgi:hypothetical protein